MSHALCVVQNDNISLTSLCVYGTMMIRGGYLIRVSRLPVCDVMSGDGSWWRQRVTPDMDVRNKGGEDMPLYGVATRHMVLKLNTYYYLLR